MNVGDNYKDYIFKLESDSSKGTAFLVSPKVAITAAHVVGKNEKIKFTLGKQNIIASVKKNDNLDIAVLILDKEFNGGFLTLNDIDVSEGDNWNTFGYPNYERDHGDRLYGEDKEINRIWQLKEDEKYNITLKYTDNPNDYSGFSGSPLIIDNCVVGIINKQVVQMGIPVRLTALSTKCFSSFVEEYGVKVNKNEKIENNFEELEVIKVDLRVTFSSTSHITGLLYQPEIELEKTSINRLIIKDVEQYSKKITYLLELARDNTKNALAKDVNFILMPEYSIHGTIGLKEIFDGLINSYVNEQILIGGIDGLTKEDFITILGDTAFEKSDREKMAAWASKQPEGKWFNTIVIIEKFYDDIRYYLQPRILCSPGSEAFNNMVEGKWITFFSTSNNEKPIHFLNLPSYDLVGNINGKRLLSIVANRIKSKNYNIGSGEHFIAFVSHCNLLSNNDEFQNSVKEILCNCSDWCDIHGRNGMVFLLNAAQKKDEFQETSIIINSNIKYKCQDNVLPTYSIVGKGGLDEYTNVIFRKKRECVHAIELVLPFSIDDCANRDIYPCIQAKVHTIDGQPVSNDPRYPNPPEAVCGYTKVINDFIDVIKEKDKLKIELQSNLIEKIYTDVLKEKCLEYRGIEKKEIIKIFNNFFKYSNYKDYKQHKANCDYWKIEIEGDAFGKFISLICLLQLSEINIQKSELFHAKLTVSSLTYNLIIIYIKESDESEITRSLRELFLNRDDDANYEKMFITIIGNVSERVLGKITDFNKRSFGSLFAGDVYCRLDDLFYDIIKSCSKLDEITKLQHLVKQNIGRRE